MTIAQKYWLWSLLVLIFISSLGGVSVVQLRGVWTSARAAVGNYQAMDRADAVRARIVWLRDSLRTPGGEQYLDARFLAPIRADLSGVIDELAFATRGGDVDGGQADLGQATVDHFDAATHRAAASTPADRLAAAAEVASELDRATQSLATIVKLAPDAARRQTAMTINRVQSGIVWTCGWLILVLLLTAIVQFRQHRALVRPLMILRDDIRRSAANDFREPVRTGGSDIVFADVAGFFNGLAGDLAELYRTLEHKIVERSRALVRSERLASVGFLAAGVAHEINNPLSIISGYAELSAKSIRRVLDGASHGTAHRSEEHAEAEAAAEADALGSALETQQIIREEAFRCKEITNRLLSLARGGSDERQTLRLDEIARHVAVLTKGLKGYRDRSIRLTFDEDRSLDVVANVTEMKQVLLNLTVNALEASANNSAEVTIGGRRDGTSVELFVQDAGKGIARDALPKVFEPFYTDKRGNAANGGGERGTGLGLTITHAIIESHHGTIAVASDGPGTGSRFTIRLPAAGGNRAARPNDAAERRGGRGMRLSTDPRENGGD